MQNITFVVKPSKKFKKICIMNRNGQKEKTERMSKHRKKRKKEMREKRKWEKRENGRKEKMGTQWKWE